MPCMNRWLTLIQEEDQCLIKLPKAIVKQLTVFPRNRVRLFDVMRLLCFQSQSGESDYFQLMNLIFNRDLAVDFCLSKGACSTDRRIKDDE